MRGSSGWKGSPLGDKEDRRESQKVHSEWDPGPSLTGRTTLEGEKG